MSSHEPAGVDDGDHVNRAIEVALVGVREAADQRDLGELIAWGQRSDDDGTYLRIDFASGRHDRQLVRYERRILSSRGADKDAETAGVIFGSAFEERSCAAGFISGAFGAVILLALGSAGSASADAPPPVAGPVHLITPSGMPFTGVPDGDRLIVDRSVDPDGYIKNPVARSAIAAATPPSCVYARDNHPGFGLAYVYVDNDCTTIQRVKVLIACSVDSSCMVIQPKTTVEFDYPNMARFDGLEAC